MNLTHYKITVLKTHSKRAVPDDAIFLGEGDILCGYGYKEQLVDKYFDVWFTPDKKEDPDNHVTLGRVTLIEELSKKETLYKTKLGKYIVEVLNDKEVEGNNSLQRSRGVLLS